ncbi:hypothetical protein BFP97_06365 [Roseivirga sp. 4D4]|uniref:helix-turn-helix domain-containing protein n=1 Tax=Roseivirga sp. 4D4 TaxID=1889784 RepID=UPI000852DB52|nr:helix-turn-helix transcriptional regulator [Roseivirga sp. 4D4]OEK01155.1 hypothetical protein BFP97_06365 [Roseivirga sp. 4D4]
MNTAKKGKASEIDIEVGKRLREIREQYKFTLEDLGHLLGITWQQVQKYEKGVNRISSSRLNTISKIFKVQMEYFFSEVENPFDRYYQAPKKTEPIEQLWAKLPDGIIKNSLYSLVETLIHLKISKTEIR